jgi:hypothetical protein
MELLKAAVPQISRVGVLWNSANAANAAILKDMEVAAPAHRDQIVDFTAKHRLPAMYGNQDYMDAGGLMFYGPNERGGHVPARSDLRRQDPQGRQAR